MKILVTGGAGFIGSNFCRYILQKYSDDKIVCLDALTYAGNMDNIEDIVHNTNFKFVKGNICNSKLVDKLFKRENFDVVINFAAESHVEKSLHSPDIFVKSNVEGVRVLLDACKKYKVSRFHQISTDEVYGSLDTKKKEVLFTETSPLNPTTPYSASKASADLLVMAYFKTFKLPVTISRCSNNFGQYQYPEKLIPLTIMRANNNQNVLVHGKGSAVRDWIYVIDHCEAIDLVIRNGKIGEIYNIGANCEKSNLQIVKTILKNMQKSQELVKYIDDRLGQDARYGLDTAKIRTELGWSSNYDFNISLEETIKWYIGNQKWLNRIKNRQKGVK